MIFAGKTKIYIIKQGLVPKQPDVNSAGRVSAQEMLAAYRRFQSGSDRDVDGLMDGRDLLEALGAAGAPRDPDPMR